MSILSTKSYKGPIKDKVRRTFWEHAIKSLTKKRENSRILRSSYIKRLWSYALNEVLRPNGFADSFDQSTLSNWLSFSDSSYKKKKADELKVAFLCGPEPQNDVEALLSLGVRVENIYAVELDSDTFQVANSQISSLYPTLKIFKGSIDEFVITYQVKFDIIYLDFTKSLLNKKVERTICRIMKSDVLEDLSIFAVNTCFPDNEEENIIKLSNYLYYQQNVEYSLFNETAEEGTYIDPFGEYPEDKFNKIISKNIEEAYSSYQTRYISNFLCLIKPFYRVINNAMFRNRLFSNQSLIQEMMEKFRKDETTYEEPQEYSLYHPYSAETDTFREETEMGHSYSIKDVTSIIYTFLDAEYSDYLDLLSESLKQLLPRLGGHFLGYYEWQLNLFCDIPMPHLILELLIYQLGHPYHINFDNHKRWRYKEKERAMCMDVFTLDKCRALYEWLPMIEHYESMIMSQERQLITRICIDAIRKHIRTDIPRQFFGGALIGINEKEWSQEYYAPKREIINIEGTL